MTTEKQKKVLLNETMNDKNFTQKRNSNKRKNMPVNDEKQHKVTAIKNPLSSNNVVSMTTTHTFILQNPYYEFIRDNIKIYEMRIYDERRRKIKVGDILMFKHNTNGS